MRNTGKYKKKLEVLRIRQAHYENVLKSNPGYTKPGSQQGNW